MDGLIRNRGRAAVASARCRKAWTWLAASHRIRVAAKPARLPLPAGAGGQPPPIRPGLRDLVMSWTTTPAFVTSALGDVLAANALATALNPSCTVGTNIIRALFLDERSTRDLYGDFDQVAAETVGVLRAAIGADLDDPDAAALSANCRSRARRSSACGHDRTSKSRPTDRSVSGTPWWASSTCATRRSSCRAPISNA